jgi:hypothetical protein
VKSAAVFGGYGTFGSIIARELARRSVPVVVLGRDGARAEAFAREIGARGLPADAREPPAEILAGEHVLVNAAGPFSELGTTLAEECARRGLHHVDIADDRRYAAKVRAIPFERSCAVYGCSSLPAISLALLECLAVSNPERVRTTLFIGNDNPKGAAAVTSVVEGLGKPITAPQGTLRGFRNGETVSLPVFGTRRVYDLESPDYDLVPAPSISVKAGFELRLATRAFALLAALSSNWGSRTAKVLSHLSVPTGSSGGVVQVEVFTGEGMKRASLAGARDGQRMAALPCVLVAERLCSGAPATGVMTAPALLGARPLLDAIAAEGFELTVA